jgi:putative toxin-antitoxin system antitoxin component (TIGR02293 family)
MEPNGNSRKRTGKTQTTSNKPPIVAEVSQKRSAAVLTPSKTVTIASPAFPAGSSETTKADIVKELSTDKESYILLGEIEEITRLPLKTLAVQIYDVTPKTLASYRTKGRHFPRRMTEVSIKLKDLYKKGIEIFSNPARFNTWLSRESAGLGHMQPLDLMGTSTGIDLVYEELLRIEFGAA